MLLSKWLYPNETPPIDEKDPRWVGCWYPGFLIAGGVVFIFSSLLMSFPEHLTEKCRLDIESKRQRRKDEKLAVRQKRAGNEATNGETKQAPAKLETIDEAAEITAEIDKTFEFLDSEQTGIGSNLGSSNDDSISSSPSIFTGIYLRM